MCHSDAASVGRHSPGRAPRPTRPNRAVRPRPPPRPGQNRPRRRRASTRDDASGRLAVGGRVRQRCQPEIVEDRDAKYTHTITLSYTFYQIDLPEEQAALAQDAETDRTLN